MIKIITIPNYINVYYTQLKSLWTYTYITTEPKVYSDNLQLHYPYPSLLQSEICMVVKAMPIS